MANNSSTLFATLIASMLFTTSAVAEQEAAQTSQSQSTELTSSETASENAATDAANTKSSVTTAPTSSGFITLETTIVGNKEQPKVLSIVPWQNPEQAGSLSTEITTQIEQVFRPLDSETLQREIVYFKQSQQ
ncbi:hypothetical protein FE810_09300 [Thalassotalea litorea]|uniref:Uncharacterized protein n=1 Tax=Thalassotalea litorea TaxID=2020715 RepID=A0A5R9III3_9GAMM|nr:hypothetical protein [Thalassotalea litorea]TLU65112.1 hypothetical protein FE810_09300 [Thalassotalea litorea]